MESLLRQTLHTLKSIKHELTQLEILDICEILVDKGKNIQFLEFKSSALLNRFLEKHHHDITTSTQALLSHIDWRFQNDIYELNLSTLSPSALAFFENGFCRFFHAQDHSNRPLIFIKLALLNSGTLESLRSHLIFVLELAKRFILSVNQQYRNAQEDVKILNISVLVDLDGFLTQFVISF